MSTSKLPLTETAALTLDLTTGTPAGTILSHAAWWVQTYIGQAGEQRSREAFFAYVVAWASVTGLPHDEATVEVQRMLEAPTAEHDDALYSMFRSMAFTRSPASWPYIARMTAEYQASGRPADDVFRRVGALLEQVESADIAVIKAFVQATTGILRTMDPATRSGVAHAEWHYISTDVAEVSVLPSRDSAGTRFPVSVDNDARLTDTLCLIAQTRLGFEPQSVGAVMFRLPNRTFDYLLHLFSK